MQFSSDLSTFFVMQQKCIKFIRNTTHLLQLVIANSKEKVQLFSIFCMKK